MTYKLKTIRFQGYNRHILLQNENGPCPLLAAMNALILRGVCQLSPMNIDHGFATLEDVTNLLALQALQQPRATAAPTKSVNDQSQNNNNNDIASKLHSPAQQEQNNHHDQQQQFFVDELVRYIPTFQYGMDVNPYLTRGCTGYEYTAQHTAFDMLDCRLVHGWLVDPSTDPMTFAALDNKTYNQLMEDVIRGKDASMELEQTVLPAIQRLQQQPDEAEGWDMVEEAKSAQKRLELEKLRKRENELQDYATTGSLIDDFLRQSAHQLTHYGLIQLHQDVKEGELCVFFRNNHFGTLTKHNGLLYLLVTDLGYAHSPGIVWEKLDMINGDTEYVNSDFRTTTSQETPSSAPTSENDADYHLAMHLNYEEQQRQQQEEEERKRRAAEQRTQQQRDSEDFMAAVKQASLRDYQQQQPQQPQAALPGGSNPEQNLAAGVDVAIPYNSSNNDNKVDGGFTMVNKTPSLEDGDRLLAMQLQNEQQQQERYGSTPFVDDEMLARQLQEQEYQARTRTTTTRTTTTSNPSASRSNGPWTRRPVPASGNNNNSNNGGNGCTIT